jgi:outer membrane lipoprotein SlyB
MLNTALQGKQNSRGWRLVLACAASLPMLTLSAGCNNAGEGAFSGAALGALVGMGLGSLSGDMGKGAAAGALIGGAGGAILGDQNSRRRDY